ncbi:MAG TPA: response regulator [Candidatus Limnocylindrales bacterium]|nr:response regulator [Candidatus Limnocylindrales bacterium]
MESILIVDDDAKIREMLSDILTDRGYIVKSVETGKEAVQESFNQLYNLALIDIRLPDMEGTELLTKLRKTEPEMIKIIITGNATLDNSIEAANKGVDGFILKPFDPKNLVKLIESKLKGQREKMRFDEKKVAEYIESRHEWMANSRFNK